VETDPTSDRSAFFGDNANFICVNVIAFAPIYRYQSDFNWIRLPL